MYERSHGVSHQAESLTHRKIKRGATALSGASYDESNTWSKHSHSIDKLRHLTKYQTNTYKCTCDIIVLKNSHM